MAMLLTPITLKLGGTGLGMSTRPRIIRPPTVVNMVMFIGFPWLWQTTRGKIWCYHPFWRSIHVVSFDPYPYIVAKKIKVIHHYFGKIRFTIHFDPYTPYINTRIIYSCTHPDYWGSSNFVPYPRMNPNPVKIYTVDKKSLTRFVPPNRKMLLVAIHTLPHPDTQEIMIFPCYQTCNGKFPMSFDAFVFSGH